MLNCTPGYCSDTLKLDFENIATLLLSIITLIFLVFHNTNRNWMKKLTCIHDRFFKLVSKITRA